MFTSNLLGYNLQELSEVSVIVRILLSLVCSGVLGFERVRKRRAAGARTYILVCVGSALVMMTSQYISEFAANTDLTRLGAQVISGIGFLGAGTIMLTGQHRIKGLTTAAGLWTVACIGIAIGAGFYFGGIALSIVVFLTMSAMSAYQMKFTKHLKRIQIYMVLDESSCLGDFAVYVKQFGMQLIEVEALESNGLRGVGVTCALQLTEHQDHTKVMSIISEFEGLQYVEEI